MWNKTKMETQILEQQLHLKCNLSRLSPWKPTARAEQDKDASWGVQSDQAMADRLLVSEDRSAFLPARDTVST